MKKIDFPVSKNRFKEVNKKFIFPTKKCKSRFYRGPDFFIIGAMKSGTTSIFQYLNFHSQIASSIIKEPCYYSYNYAKGRNWYLSQFPIKRIFPRKQILFDCSPVYLHDADAAQRIFKDYPKTKLIAILRDPIKRAISHYNYYSSPDSNFAKNPNNKIDLRSIEEAFKDDLIGREKRRFFRYCRIGQYGEQVKNYLDYFKREQMLFIDSSDLENNPVDVLFEIADFIGIKDKKQFFHFNFSTEKVRSQSSFSKAESKEYKKFNVQDYSLNISNVLDLELKEFFRKDVELLIEITNKKFSWSSKYISE